MTRGFYFRWVVILLVAGIIVGLAVQRYSTEVRTVNPGSVLSHPQAAPVRALGMVEAGSLVKTEPFSEARFSLAQGDDRITVFYQGQEPDNLRELKTLVVVGTWDPEQGQFLSSEIDLVPNFGFVLAAYLVLIPVALFLFLMERRVALLYNEIKESKIYEVEVGELDKG